MDKKLNPEDLIIEQANTDDSKAILELQRLAFKREAEIYNDFSISPLTQTQEELTREFDEKVFLKSSINGRIVGSVRAYEIDGTCYIERFMVHPDFQKRGIGAGLIKAIEERFSQVRRYELIVKHKNENGIKFYRKHGYGIFKTEPYSKYLEFMYMQKPGKGKAPPA